MRVRTVAIISAPPPRWLRDERDIACSVIDIITHQGDQAAPLSR